ncbi:MAG: YdhR family protein [Caldilineaceae bacterium]
MSKSHWKLVILFVLLASGLALTIGSRGAQAAPAGQEAPKLNTSVVTGTVVMPGRAIVNARSNHWVVDSPGLLAGPNQEVNPLELLLGALNTCGIFIYEKAAQELGIPLDSISAVTEGDFAAQGLKDGSVNPRLRAFRVKINMSGPSVAQANQLRAQFKTRCPIYTTLSLAAPIDIMHVGMDDQVGALLEVAFTYDFATADEYIAAVSPMAEQWAAVPGLLWKIWTLNPETKRAGAVYLFESAEARQAYLDSELAAAVANQPHFSDFAVTPYGVMGAESRVTNAPLIGSSADAAAENPGVILEVAFTYDFATAEEYITAVSPLAEQWNAVPGLIWKTWTLNPETKRAGAVYHFESAEAAQAYLESELGQAVANHPHFSEFDVQIYGIMAAETSITHGPVGK